MLPTELSQIHDPRYEDALGWYSGYGGLEEAWTLSSNTLLRASEC